MNYATLSKYSNSDTEEISDPDSPLDPHASELETIFELDEANSCLPVGQLRRSRDRPPLGRLRREAPRQVTTTQQLEFPGIFVEGFRDGHVGFNIPGIMQDSLKPTDSIEVKINLFTPAKHSDFGVSSTEQSGYPQCSSRFGSIAGSFAVSQGSKPNNMSGRFGVSWLPDNAPDDPSPIDRFNPLESTNGGLHSSQADPTSESSFGLGTTENTRNNMDLFRASNRFSSVHHPPFGHDSTDSGLHSNGGLAPDLFAPDTSELSSEYADLSSRFIRFGIR